MAFSYHHHTLHAERVSLETIAQRFGTPCYVYSRAIIEQNWHLFDQAFQQKPHRICYAVKANSNLAILNILARLGSGFDIVSQGELARVLAAGGDPQRIIFSGVGKTTQEIVAALTLGIYCFDVESESELQRIEHIAQQENKIAPIALRINPDIDARTHPYISTGLHENKFGIEYANAMALIEKIKTMSHVKLIGIACHIGSQITELSPFSDAVDRMLVLVDFILKKNIALKQINFGGGLGVRYHTENPPKVADYIAVLRDKCKNYALDIVIEPGRAIVANAGILLTRVEYLKHHAEKNFAIVDAAMNDLIRPALYAAWQSIIPVQQKNAPEKIYDVVGPVCESADFLGKNRSLALAEGDLLAITDAGAYGFSMSSNYNSRPRVAEVLVDGDNAFLIRERETIEELFAKETMPLPKS